MGEQKKNEFSREKNK